MKHFFHHAAEQEFFEAINYYEEKENSLGYDFAVEVYSTIERIISFPNAWPLIDEDIRRALVRRFPFGILYHEEKGEIFILAVMNLHRNPGYWKLRKKNK
nr:type II toxin-antitoxin system RelE/ParE family toxin [Desulfobulbaceae bacterium]